MDDEERESDEREREKMDAFVAELKFFAWGLVTFMLLCALLYLMSGGAR